MGCGKKTIDQLLYGFKNLDLSNWMNNQKPTEMSGLFIFDAGFTKKGALDKINMNLEMVESRLFNQGEISVHGQLFYSDSVYLQLIQ